MKTVPDTLLCPGKLSVNFYVIRLLRALDFIPLWWYNCILLFPMLVSSFLEAQMAKMVPFSELSPGDEFLILKDEHWTRFRKIASPASVLGKDFAEMNAIQLGGGRGLHTLDTIEEDVEVKVN